jgi:hypothetical protein
MKQENSGVTGTGKRSGQGTAPLYHYFKIAIFNQTFD